MMANQVGPVLSNSGLSTGLRGRKRNQRRERIFHQGQGKFLQKQAGYIDASFSILSDQKNLLRRWVGPYIHRDCASRNALSGVKVSSPDKHLTFVAAMRVCRSEAISGDLVSLGATGVQVHGEFRRRLLELGRSLKGRSRRIRFNEQGIIAKFKIIPIREVRGAHTSALCSHEHRNEVE